MPLTDLLTQGIQGASALIQGFPTLGGGVTPVPVVGDWDDLLINTVIFQTVLTSADTSSDSGKRTPSTGTRLVASVQPVDPSEMVAHGAVESVGTHRLFFGAEPLDTSTGARSDGRCRVNDLFLWPKDARNPSRVDVLYAVGEAVDVAGWGVAWTVDCVLRT